MISFSAFSDELEKIALGESGAESFKKQVAESKKQGYRDILHRVEGAPSGKQRFALKRHDLKDVSFGEGLKRNAVATGRRLSNPKRWASRVKWSLTNPAAPKWMRAASGLGLAATAANVIPKETASGKSRLNRALQVAGGTIGGVAGRGFTGGLVGGAVGSGVGGLAGDAIDKLRGYKPKARKAEVAE